MMDKDIFKGIKNLLFDLGGVVVDIRRENCVKALKAIGIKDAESMLGDYCQKGAFLLLEEGKITPAQFRDEMRKFTDKKVTDGQLDDALNKFIIGIPEHRLKTLDLLHKEFKVYALSNTNEIMFDSILRQEFSKDGKRVEDYFDGMCLSYKEGCAKPDPQIFNSLINKFGIIPSETMFFDDSQTNLEAAEKLGFRTWLVKPGTEFKEAFDLK